MTKSFSCQIQHISVIPAYREQPNTHRVHSKCVHTPVLNVANLSNGLWPKKGSTWPELRTLDRSLLNDCAVTAVAAAVHRTHRVSKCRLHITESEKKKDFGYRSWRWRVYTTRAIRNNISSLLLQEWLAQSYLMFSSCSPCYQYHERGNCSFI